MLDKAKDFGFYSTPPLELPANERAPSGLYDFKAHKLIDDASQVDPGRLAFGQERMLVDPAADGARGRRHRERRRR